MTREEKSILETVIDLIISNDEKNEKQHAEIRAQIQRLLYWVIGLLSTILIAVTTTVLSIKFG